MLDFNKFRVLWQENYSGITTSDAVNLKFTFDGISWIDTKDFLTFVRSSSSSGFGYNISKNINGSLYNELDLTLTPTVTNIPVITEVEIIPSTDADAFAAGTYYIATTSTSFPNPGKELSLPEVFFTSPISNIKKIELTENAKINIYVRYADFIRGINVYIGTEVSNNIVFKLRYKSNLCNLLQTSLSSTSTKVVLKNKVPFPKNGIIKVNSEFITYSSCVLNSSTGFYELSITSGKLMYEHPVDSDIYYIANIDDKYSDSYYVPKRLYPIFKPSDNIMQYLNFDYKDSKNMIKTRTNNKQIAPNGIVLDSVDYSSNISVSKTSLRLSGKGTIDTGFSMPKDGTLHFHFMLSEYLDSDKYLFGDIDGLWMKVNSSLNRPEIGYKENVIISSSDPRMEYIKLNEFIEFAIAWDSNDDYTIISFYRDTKQVAEEIIPKTSNGGLEKFNPGRIYIGSLKLSTLNPSTNKMYKDQISGYIDDWKFYDECLSELAVSTISSDISNTIDEFSGKVELNSSLPDYSNVVICNITLYTEKGITIPKTEIESYYEKEYKLYFDSGFLQILQTGGTVSTGTKISYPLHPKMIKFMIELSNPESQDVSPILKNFRVITSSASVDFK